MHRLLGHLRPTRTVATALILLQVAITRVTGSLPRNSGVPLLRLDLVRRGIIIIPNNPNNHNPNNNMLYILNINHMQVKEVHHLLITRTR